MLTIFDPSRNDERLWRPKVPLFFGEIAHRKAQQPGSGMPPGRSHPPAALGDRRGSRRAVKVSVTRLKHDTSNLSP